MRRSYLSPVHLSHLSRTPITEEHWALCGKTSSVKRHCCLVPVFVVTFKNRMKSSRGVKATRGPATNRQRLDVRELIRKKATLM